MYPILSEKIKSLVQRVITVDCILSTVFIFIVRTCGNEIRTLSLKMAVTFYTFKIELTSLSTVSNQNQNALAIHFTFCQCLA